MHLLGLLLLLLTRWATAVRLEDESILAPGPDSQGPAMIAANNTSLVQAAGNREPPEKYTFDKESAKKKYEMAKKAADHATGALKKAHITAKVDDATKKQIDDCLRVAEGLGSIMMMVAPVAGPAAPFLFAGGTALSIVGGSGGNLIESTTAEVSFAAQVKAEMEVIATDLSLQITDVSGQVQINGKKIDGVFQTLMQNQQMLQHVMLKDYRNAFNNVDKWSHDFVGWIQEGISDEDLFLALDEKSPQIQDWQKALDSQSWASDLRQIVKCKSCGGFAAAALFFHRYATARAQLYNFVFTYHRLQGEKGARFAKTENRHFSEALGTMKDIAKELSLEVWIQLPREELSLYANVQAKAHVWAKEIAMDARFGNTGNDMARLELVKEVYQQVVSDKEKGRALAMQTDALAKFLNMISATTEIRVHPDNWRTSAVGDVPAMCLGLKGEHRQSALILKPCADFPNEDKWFEFKESHDGVIQPVGLRRGEGQWQSEEMCIDDEEHLKSYRAHIVGERDLVDGPGSFTYAAHEQYIANREMVRVWISGRNCYRRQRQGIDFRIQVSGPNKTSGEAVYIGFPADDRLMVHLMALEDMTENIENLKTGGDLGTLGYLEPRWVHTFQFPQLGFFNKPPFKYPWAGWDLPGVSMCTYAVKLLEALGKVPSHMIPGHPVKAKLQEFVDVHYKQYPDTPSLQGVFYPCAEAANSFLQQFD